MAKFVSGYCAIFAILLVVTVAREIFTKRTCMSLQVMIIMDSCTVKRDYEPRWREHDCEFVAAIGLAVRSNQWSYTGDDTFNFWGKKLLLRTALVLRRSTCNYTLKKINLPPN